MTQSRQGRNPHGKRDCAEWMTRMTRLTPESPSFYTRAYVSATSILPSFASWRQDRPNSEASVARERASEKAGRLLASGAVVVERADARRALVVVEGDHGSYKVGVDREGRIVPARRGGPARTGARPGSWHHERRRRDPPLRPRSWLDVRAGGRHAPCAARSLRAADVEAAAPARPSRPAADPSDARPAVVEARGCAGNRPGA